MQQGKMLAKIIPIYDQFMVVLAWLLGPLAHSLAKVEFPNQCQLTKARNWFLPERETQNSPMFYITVCLSATTWFPRLPEFGQNQT